MRELIVQVAIISDLHCYHSSSGSDETYLTTDLLRSSAKDHPVESLLRLIQKEDLQVELTLCPGDFTNKSDKQGLISGWDFVQEISQKLGSNEIVATLGNHDVDSFESFSTYSLEIPKGIKKGFPIENEDERDTFWAKGCVFLERDKFRILVINSSHFHHNKEEAKSGKVDSTLIEYVDEYMREIDDDKISLVLSHHHPIDHSRLKLGEADKIVNADELLEQLGKYQFDLFIHGHKHDPLLRYHGFHSQNGRIPIFASGSFSALTNLSWTGQRNTFHIVELVKNDNDTFGRIKTWTFTPKSGWETVFDSTGFDAFTGFGYKGTISDLADKVANIVGTEKIMLWTKVVESIPNLQYLIPSESQELENALKEKHLILSGRLSENPEIISNIKSIQK